MSTAVAEVIRKADSLLPGIPADEGTDPRWQAIIAVGEFVETEPEAVWAFICRWGDHQQEDLRDAIATCLLEHLLEHHFATFFPRLKPLALANSLFADTFLRCWEFGQALERDNAELYTAVRAQLADPMRAEPKVEFDGDL